MIRPPSDQTSEQSLLAACLAEQVVPPVAIGDFTTELHQYVYRSMSAVERENRPLDLIVIGQKLTELSNGKYGPVDVGTLALMAGNGDHIDVYADIVRQFGVARRLQHLAHNYVAETSEISCDLKKAIDKLSSGVLSFADTTKRSREVGMLEGMKEFIAAFEERVASQCGIIGLPTGIQFLDKETCGLSPQNYYVLAARPSMGKTALALQITRFLAGLGKSVLWFSMDMPRQQLHERMVASESKMDLHLVRSGFGVTPYQHKQILEYSNSLTSLPVIIHDGVCTDVDIVRKTRKIKPDLVIIDFLTKTIPSVDLRSSVSNYTHVSRTFKNLFKEMNIPGLVLCQLSRSNDKDGRAPKLSDLRETGAIEEDADVVMFLHADKGDKTLPTRTILIDKNRNGQCSFQNMAFLGKWQRFEELAY